MENNEQCEGRMPKHVASSNRSVQFIKTAKPELELEQLVLSGKNRRHALVTEHVPNRVGQYSSHTQYPYVVRLRDQVDRNRVGHHTLFDHTVGDAPERRSG